MKRKDRETKKRVTRKERKRGQMLVLGRERAIRVGLCDVYSLRPLLHDLELAAGACVR